MLAPESKLYLYIGVNYHLIWHSPRIIWPYRFLLRGPVIRGFTILSKTKCRQQKEHRQTKENILTSTILSAVKSSLFNLARVTKLMNQAFSVPVFSDFNCLKAWQIIAFILFFDIPSSCRMENKFKSKTLPKVSDCYKSHTGLLKIQLYVNQSDSAWKFSHQHWVFPHRIQVQWLTKSRYKIL